MKLISKTRRSGETVQIEGIYTSSCCDHQQPFEAGDRYTRCLKCMNLCVWKSESEAGAANELTYLEPMAA
jgi:hypothetical protein